MSGISTRCRQIMREIQAGADPAPYADELDRMEEWLREHGQWAEESGGSWCPWHEQCRCTHKGCTDGWLNTDVPGLTVGGKESLGMALRCPECVRGRSRWELVKKQTEKKPRRSV